MDDNVFMMGITVPDQTFAMTEIMGGLKTLEKDKEVYYRRLDNNLII